MLPSEFTGAELLYRAASWNEGLGVKAMALQISDEFRSLLLELLLGKESSVSCFLEFL